MSQKPVTERFSRPARFQVGFLTRPAFVAWFALCVFAVSFFFSPVIFSQAVPQPAAESVSSPEIKKLEVVKGEKKADKVSFTAPMHPWGDFQPGAWRLTKTCVETFESSVSSNNITCTDNYITLQKVAPAELVLMTESVLNLAGKSIKIEPQELRRGFHGLDLAEFKKFKTLAPQSLVVDGQPVPCEVVEFEFSDEKFKKSVKMWVHKSRLPYVFRKELRVFHAKDGTEEEFTVTEISSMNQQVVALGRIFHGYQTRVESRFPTRSVSSVMLSSPQVPGGVVSRVSREKDLKGRTIQVATTELMDFGRTPEEHQNEFLRNSPVQVARRTAFRPTVPLAAAGSAKTLELTLNFSQEVAAQRSLPEDVYESYGYIKFRNRLWKNRGKTVHARTSAEPGQEAFRFTEAEITIAGPAMKDSSVPGMVTVSLNVPQRAAVVAPEEKHPVSIFAKPDSQPAVADGKASRVEERRSPLYQLRKKDFRKRRGENKVALLASETCPEQYQDENTGFIDLSVVYDPSEQPSEKDMPRGSWRRHWRAAIFGERAER